jgi:hypothetical protein
MLLLNGIQIVLRSHQYSTQALHRKNDGYDD